MRKISLILIILIISQGILIVLIADFLLSQQYMNNWINYPSENQMLTIYLKNVEKEKQTDVQQYLLQTSDEQHLFFVRRDLLLDNNSNFDGFKIGIYGDPTISGVSMSFLGETILDEKNLTKLLTSKNQNSTLGVDTGSINSIGAIPFFNFGEHIVVEKMPRLISESATVNGAYSVLGFEGEAPKIEFISELSKISGLSQEALVTQTNGAAIDDSLRRDILIIILALQIFINFLLFLVITIMSLPEQSKLALLGWSRISFAAKIYGRFFIASIIEIPFLIIVGWLLSGWNEFSPMLCSHLSMATMINLVLVVMELAAASVVIIMTKSLDAIRGRFSKKPLYILGSLAYLLVSAGIVLCGSYVDGPIQSLSENAKISSCWAEVSNYQMLSKIAAGQDTDSFSSQSNKLDEDVYHWYASIADNNGVFLINTQYFSDVQLARWSNSRVYKTIPAKPFWYFAVSPNYLSELNIKLNNDDLSDAKNGTRLYLLPSTLSNSDRDRLIVWIRDRDVSKLEPGDIQTKFSQQQHFEFATYNPGSNLFTWAIGSDSATMESAPIIYVCTPENMRYFESESLRAIGFNGYIKFADDKAMQQYTQPEILIQFDLSDNNLCFSSVQQYIDGLQKSLRTAIQWFGLVFFFLFIILTGLLITLATIFRIANQEKINVKKFMGFSFCQVYMAPTITLIILIILEIAASIALNSKFGVLIVVFVSLLQLFIFVKYMTRCELKRVLLAFKGGSQ